MNDEPGKRTKGAGQVNSCPPVRFFSCIPFGRFCRCHKNRRQFFGLLEQLGNPRTAENSSLLEELNPIYCFLKFLQPALNLADKFRIGPCTSCFAILRPNRSSATKHLLAEDLRLGRLGKGRIKANDSESKRLCPRFQVMLF